MFVVFEGLDVFVEIGWAGRTNAEGVDFGSGEAIKVVKNHGADRGAKAGEFFRWGVEFAAFVIGADDEDAHVELASGFDGGPVQVIDEIPVKVEVIELTTRDRLVDDIRGCVGAEANEAATAFALKFPRGFQAASVLERPIKQFAVVDAVK